MRRVAVAFLWHQHQPYYPDDVAGRNPMPWVRLHGVKDYWGMAQHLAEFPEMHCTINLVPSLIQQIEAYTDRGASDEFLDVSRRPADGLSEAEALFLLDHFFMANVEHMIRPLPRFAELYERRGLGRSTAADALRRFGERDLRDLQVCFNLAWVHPILFEEDAGLRDLRNKGRGYTEDEKRWLLDRHLEILLAILPLHRRLAESRQVELTTTPYYHPILPLLFDKKLAREAMPDVRLPRYTGGYLEDAAAHVGRAVELHARVFGQAPRGMWPAEGSVCQSMLPLLAEHGIRWIATDEEVLSASTQGFISRDSRGYIRNPERMYRPYKVAEGNHSLGIVFRDHALSDLLGFHYQRSDPSAAADDFMMRVRAIGDAVNDSEPALVSVILDGENCWEHYPGGGVPFLRALYRRLANAEDVRPVSIDEYLDQHPPRDTLPRLFAGSWINHNFAIWIGHEEDNTAWDALHAARQHLQERTAAFRAAGAGIAADPGSRRAVENPSLSERIRQAWEEIYIAEGSDWFWWFGDDHSSSQDALFDYLFRKHLQNVYLLLGDLPPPELGRPISRRGHRPLYTLPRAFLQVKLDGRETFFEWISAGRYTLQNERGTMAMGAHGPIRDLYFGFDVSTLFVRVDLDGPARTVLADYDTLRVGFTEPAGRELRIAQPAGPSPVLEWWNDGRPTPASDVGLGLDRIVELAIPFEGLGVAVGESVQFFVDLLEGPQSRDRAPREGTIQLTRPSPDFEQVMWDV